MEKANHAVKHRFGGAAKLVSVSPHTLTYQVPDWAAATEKLLIELAVLGYSATVADTDVGQVLTVQLEDHTDDTTDQAHQR